MTQRAKETQPTATFPFRPMDCCFLPAKDSTKTTPLPAKGSNSFPSSWSKNGNFILYSQMSLTTKDDLWLLPMNSSGEQKPRVFRQTPAKENQGTFSPDGQWIAYT